MHNFDETECTRKKNREKIIAFIFIEIINVRLKQSRTVHETSFVGYTFFTFICDCFLNSYVIDL